MLSHAAVPSVPSVAARLPRGVYRAPFTASQGCTRLFSLDERGELAGECTVRPGVSVEAARDVLEWLLDQEHPIGPRLMRP